MNYTFRKSERLTSQKLITALFQKGIFSLYSAPFRFSFVPSSNQDSSCQVLIIVPKRNFETAINRNRIKRQLRELYRLHKQPLLEKLNSQDKQIALMISYTGKPEMDFNLLKPKFVEALKKISDAV
jgi:ribonuclease P protein component